jgi:hypothetical protein
MSYKITKLDRRHNGYTWYKYYITPGNFEYHESRRLLTDLRNWCWDTYGPSAELGWNQEGSLWAWDTEHNNKRIYLKSDAEMTLFKLKYSG